MQTPSKPLAAQGLPYSSDDNVYAKLEVRQCNVNDNSTVCSSTGAIKSLTAKGRIFLFI